jgi:class 3 adenylate cyclase
MEALSLLSMAEAKQILQEESKLQLPNQPPKNNNNPQESSCSSNNNSDQSLCMTPEQPAKPLLSRNSSNLELPLRYLHHRPSHLDDSKLCISPGKSAPFSSSAPALSTPGSRRNSLQNNFIFDPSNGLKPPSLLGKNQAPASRYRSHSASDNVLSSAEITANESTLLPLGNFKNIASISAENARVVQEIEQYHQLIVNNTVSSKNHTAGARQLVSSSSASSASAAAVGLKSNLSKLSPVQKLFPSYSIDGELDRKYILKQRSRQRKSFSYSLLVYGLFFALLELLYALEPSYQVHSSILSITLRLVTSLAVILFAAVVRMNRFNLVNVYLDLFTFLILTTSSVLLIIVEISRSIDQNIPNNHNYDILDNALVLYLCSTYLLLCKRLQLRLIFCFLHSAITLAAYIISLSIAAFSPNSFHRHYSINNFTENCLIQLCIIGFLLILRYFGDKKRENELKSYRTMYIEGKKSQKLLESMFPSSILVNFFNAKSFILSKTATVAFVQIELGLELDQFSGFYYRRKSFMFGDDAAGAAAQFFAGMSTNNGVPGSPQLSLVQNNAENSPVDGRTKRHSNSLGFSHPSNFSLVDSPLPGANRGRCSPSLRPESSFSALPISPSDIMSRLHDTFKRIDSIVNVYSIRGVHKIETVSKTYLLEAGLLENIDDHAAAMIEMSLEIAAMIRNNNRSRQRIPSAIRIGLNTGQVVGGIIGTQRKFFRIFGDTVNVSSRMCYTAKIGEIAATKTTFDALSAREKLSYNWGELESARIKGKGLLQFYKITGRQDWQPKFDKSVIQRGINIPASNTSSQSSQPNSKFDNKTFVYEKLIHFTQLSPYSLRFNSADPQLESNFQHITAAAQLKLNSFLHFLLSLISLIMTSCLMLIDGAVAGLIVLLVGLTLLLIANTALTYANYFYIKHQQAIALCTLIALQIINLLLLGLLEFSSPINPVYVQMAIILYATTILQHFKFVAPLIILGLLSLLAVCCSQLIDFASLLLIFFHLGLLATLALLILYTHESNRRLSYLYRYSLQREHQQMNNFFNNLLPGFVVEILKKQTAFGQSNTALDYNNCHPVQHDSAQTTINPNLAAVSSRFTMQFPDCTVFESDIVNYTRLVGSWRPVQTLNLLNFLFSQFDRAALESGVEKIETIGDAFMAVLFHGEPSPILNFALQLKGIMKNLNYKQFCTAPNASEAPEEDSSNVNTKPEPMSKGQISNSSSNIHYEERGSECLGSTLTPAHLISPRIISGFNSEGNSINIRCGIARGAAYGAVLGSQIPRFHLSGSAHDLAIAIEQNGRAGEILVSSSVYEITFHRYHYKLFDQLVEGCNVWQLISNNSPLTTTEHVAQNTTTQQSRGNNPVEHSVDR